MSGSRTTNSEQREQLMEKHRYINVDDDWCEPIKEAFIEDMERLGIYASSIYFSGFSSQGDGACFTGFLVNSRAYMEHHHKGQYPMIHKLLEHDGEVYVRCDANGRYCNEYSTSFWVDADTLTGMLPQPTKFHETIVEQWQEHLREELYRFEDDLIEQWRTYMRDLYRKLEAEYNYLISDEAVWETIVAIVTNEQEKAA